MTLIEVLVAITVIAVMAGLLYPALMIVRKKSAITATRQMVTQLDQSLTSYRAADGEHRFPPVQSDVALALRPPTVGSSAVLALLERFGLPALKPTELDAEGRLVDPWGEPIRYTLTRPTVSDPTSLESWNWDSDAGRVRAWGRRWDTAANAINEGPLPFAYVYSLGPTARTDRGADWIFNKDQP